VQLTLVPSELPIRIRTEVPLDDAALYELCARNPELRIERTPAGELVVMPPTGGESGRRNAALLVDLGMWTRQAGTGVVFDSSTGFVLPNGAERGPDAAWVAEDRWAALTAEERRRFPPLCPDFVVEIRSPSDAIDDLHAKLREYLDNGARLGWLIDPDARTVWIYRPGGAVERHDAPAAISGEPVLPGFSMSTARMW
jgi:Uma2 family endonuclease